jgi:hypothetical protein
MTPKEARSLERYLTPAERDELNSLIAADIKQHAWRPLPGPQTMAYESKADVIGFGGAAGGGKTDLAIGLATEEHYRTQFFRREGPQLTGVIDRLAEIVGSRDLINGKPAVYRDADDRQIEFNSMPNLGDETKYQGRPKDLLVIDEAANFLEQQVRFVKGWVRTTRPGQRTRTLMTFNPPTNAEGRWVIGFFAPWLDKRHTLYPTGPGKLRYVYVDPETGNDVWIADDDHRPFVLIAGVRTYDFNPDDYRPEEIVQPESRTFVPSRITDNPFLVSTGYMAQLQALPEPLRSQMLNGNFEAGQQDDPWQVVPTAWAEIAMNRWKERARKGEMLSMGVDVARGGKDSTAIARRHKTEETEHWYDRLSMYPGTETPNGRVVAGLVIAEHRDHAPIHLDVIGVGASPFDVLTEASQPVYGINVSEKATSMDKSGRLSFFNLRSQSWWQMREDLDPDANNGICLPPDPELLKELCAPRWEMSGLTIKVESRESIVSRVGRSPDRASAVILARMDTPKVRALRYLDRESVPDNVLDYDPYSKR